MFKRVSHTMMYVNDVERAVRFYVEKLGARINFVAGKEYASLNFDQYGYRLDLHLTEAAGKDVGFGPILYFSTNEFDKTAAALKKLGIKIGAARTEGKVRFMTFWDSEGNTLGVEEIK